MIKYVAFLRSSLGYLENTTAQDVVGFYTRCNKSVDEYYKKNVDILEGFAEQL
jgi:hypothetical protein